MNIFFTNRKIFYVQLRSLLLQLKNVENRAKKVHAKNRALTLRFPCYQSGNCATLNLDCESSR